VLAPIWPGGPNHVGNQVDAPVLVYNEDTVYHNPVFYHLSHWAKVIPRGSRQVKLTELRCTLSQSVYCENAVAFVTPKTAPAGATWTPNSLVVVLTNDEITAVPQHFGGIGEVSFPARALGQGSLTVSTKDVTYSVGCGDNFVSGTLPWNSIATVVMPCPNGECDCKPAEEVLWCNEPSSVLTLEDFCNGAPCLLDSNCASGQCTNLKCTGTGSCNKGHGANLCDGEQCALDSSCQSGRCWNYQCASLDEKCNGGHGNDLCDGMQCALDNTCQSGKCYDYKCAAKDACNPNPTSLSEVTQIATGSLNYCNGMACTGNLDCQSGQCFDYKCSDATCNPGKTLGGTDMCEGAYCTTSASCQSKSCVGNKCSAPDTCNQSPASDDLCVGQSCALDSSCKSGKCYGWKCASPNACNPDAGVGATNLCDGQTCSADSACQSGKCYGWKCSSASCNSYGPGGTNLCEGTKCTGNSQCGSNKCYNWKCAAPDACNPGPGSDLCSGATCALGSSCRSGTCSWFRCT